MGSGLYKCINSANLQPRPKVFTVILAITMQFCGLTPGIPTTSKSCVSRSRRREGVKMPPRGWGGCRS
jgi:hypothetical protein